VQFCCRLLDDFPATAWNTGIGTDSLRNFRAPASKFAFNREIFDFQYLLPPHLYF
jgi:hypothetical protein